MGKGSDCPGLLDETHRPNGRRILAIAVIGVEWAEGPSGFYVQAALLRPVPELETGNSMVHSSLEVCH
jgi:hypothetical protein